MLAVAVATKSGLVLGGSEASDGFMVRVLFGFGNQSFFELKFEYRSSPFAVLTKRTYMHHSTTENYANTCSWVSHFVHSQKNESGRVRARVCQNVAGVRPSPMSGYCEILAQIAHQPITQAHTQQPTKETVKNKC